MDFDRWREVLTTLKRNKVRTLMTASGVFWGIFMLICMIGFGNGLQRGVRENMVDFTANGVFLWGQHTTLPFKGYQPGRHVGFTNTDIEVLRTQLDGIRHFAPRLQLGGYRDGINVTHGEKTGNYSIMGDYPDIQHIDKIIPKRGRFLNTLDLRENRKVAVIGEQVHEVLFSGQQDPIGASINIRGVHFTVVGLVRSEQPGEQGEKQKASVYIPFTTFQRAFNQNNEVGWFALAGRPDASAFEIEQQARRILMTRHEVNPEDAEAIGSFNSADAFGKVQGVFTGIQFFVWFVGLITLLAGVLGVSNIMLIIVKERTREFGIRKALGATAGSIVGLVVQESIALTALSGYAGLIAGVGVLELAGSLLGPGSGALGRPEIDLSVALIALVILMLSGLIAGVVPARHAAKIDPVVALRSE